MNSVLSRKPRKIVCEDELLIEWKDGSATRIDWLELRYRCPCASCLDEITNERLVRRHEIKAGIRPANSEYVGNYALRIFWNDGHDTGIYTFRSLKENFGKSAHASP